jgi:diadenosine tetraphosphate (Ap4A) HIT family hydrolase
MRYAASTMFRFEQKRDECMDFLITRTAHYIVEHCYSCAVPGYLIVSTTDDVDSISTLSAPAQSQLGSVLALAGELVTDVVQPLKVYCAQFGEEDARLHFHVFPRSGEMTARFIQEFPEQDQLIHGPLLLDWARSAFSASNEEVWSIARPVIETMKLHCKASQKNN